MLHFQERIITLSLFLKRLASLAQPGLLVVLVTKPIMFPLLESDTNSVKPSLTVTLAENFPRIVNFTLADALNEVIVSFFVIARAK